MGAQYFSIVLIFASERKARERKMSLCNFAKVFQPKELSTGAVHHREPVPASPPGVQQIARQL